MTSLEGPYIKAQSGQTKQVILLLHGYGADGNDLISLGETLKMVFSDADFIAPHAPFMCQVNPFGREWFDLRDWEASLFGDQEYLLQMFDRTKNARSILNQFIDEVLAENNLQESNLAYLGFSQGSMMALATALNRTNPCAGVLSYSGGFVCRDKSYVKSRPPIYLVHGEDDEVIQYQAMEKTAQFLQSVSIHPQTLLCEHTPHSISQEGLEAGARFLKACFAQAS